MEFMSLQQDYAVEDVIKERRRQEKKFGSQTHDAFTWLTILMEEVGELAECALHAKFGGPEAENYRTELVQVAAVALQMLEKVS